jgi:release factor glutamine methyltransferase
MQNPQLPRDQKWTILKCLKWTTSYFQSHDIDSPRATAEILLADVLKTSRIDLYVRYDQPVTDRELLVYKTLIKRRIQREPVSYIVGIKEFWSMELRVTPGVLIPRPETECLVEKALSILTEPVFSFQRPRRILEIGTGSGAIILALASECPTDLFFASELSIPAIELAKKNTKCHHLDQKIMFFSSDLFAGLRENTCWFDMILSNPPYIPSSVINTLQPEIVRYEPLIALDGKQDGLYFIQKIVHDAQRYLKPRGALLLEIGHDQKTAVENIIESSNAYEKVAFEKDYSGHFRMVHMRKKTTTLLEI